MENIRDWLFVDHVYTMKMLLGKPGQKYCIGGFKEITNLDMVESICNTLDILRPINHSYKKLIRFVADRPGHDFRYAVNTQKIEEEILWKSTSEFSSALEKTIIWYLENESWCKDV